MGQYSKSGLYARYKKKNNTERAALDYYATPTKEVENILQIIKPEFTDTTFIWEPSCGGGHMLQGIVNYCNENNMRPAAIIASDIVDRKAKDNVKNEKEICIDYLYGDDWDYLNPDIERRSNWIIMNPPYSTIEAHVTKALEECDHLLLLARLQFLEGQKRFKTIFSQCPPSDVYVYVDRIKCYKNGDFTYKDDNAIQAYAWFYWNNTKEQSTTQVHWLYSVNAT